MTIRQLHWLTFVGCLLLAVWVFTRRRGPQPEHLDTPLRALPESSLLAVTLDLERARKTGFDRKLIEAFGFSDGSNEVIELCGFDPIDAIDQLGLSFVPADSDETALAIAGTGTVDAERLVDCASRAIEKRHGTPVRTPMGEFTAVRDSDSPESAEIAVRPGGPVLVATASLIRSMVDAAERRVPSLADNLEHRGLREAIGGDAILVVSWVPTESWLADFARTASARAPLGAVRAAAFRLAVDERVQMSAAILCMDPPRCALLEQAAHEMHAELGQSGGLEVHVERVKPAELAIRFTVSHASAASLLAEMADLVEAPERNVDVPPPASTPWPPAEVPEGNGGASAAAAAAPLPAPQGNRGAGGARVVRAVGPRPEPAGSSTPGAGAPSAASERLPGPARARRSGAGGASTGGSGVGGASTGGSGVGGASTGGSGAGGAAAAGPPAGEARAGAGATSVPSAGGGASTE